ETLGYAGQVHGLGYSVGVQKSDSTTDAQGQVTGYDSSGLQVQVQSQFDQLETVLGLQMLRAVENGETSSSRLIAADFTRQFGKFGFTLLLQANRQDQETTPPLGPTTQTGGTLSLFRQFGHTTFTVADTLQHTVGPGSDAFSQIPLVTVARQISPALSAGVSFGLQRVTDKLDPAADSHSRIFAITLSSPFSLGNTLTTGRPDPRLPAMIAGRVQVASATSTTTPSYVGFSGASGSGGISNVEVVLDNQYIQRTDLTGGFQFSFVSPGQHQLRVETSSLPRGTTAATPVQIISIEGGQEAQVVFQVGNFGGILGHVYGTDTSGNPVPLPDVKLRVDGGSYSQTDSSGEYGFGGLTPGSHTVEVIENTIPAFASFDPSQLKQSVDVSNGSYTKLDFDAQALGSISGKILYGPEMARDHMTGGVPNAYVVAEPGEHAAIDDDDGNFIIDNLPAGDYTVSVDPETLDEGLGAGPSSVTVHLGPGEHYEGVGFTVGRFEKKVVFSLLSGSSTASAPVIHLAEGRLPPGGTTEVTVDAPPGAKNVTLAVFGGHVPLSYDKSRKRWTGEIAVPKDAKAGDYDVDAAVASGTVPTSTTLRVDPSEPLVIVTYAPKNAPLGTTVSVRARFLVDVKAGDRIEWEDGDVTVLSKPVTGRVFTFDVRLSLRPLHGLLLTRGGKLPIELL
ncbi:MAG TPA: carboxypeptidase-like regulatory domain-containing protein, partial [Candidatus Acidoferrales bacterium]|nr:carboxypeptidase-like regulatory domain-containing protein [Candidatus Acidoferrales bacterium]